MNQKAETTPMQIRGNMQARISLKYWGSVWT